MLQHHIYQRTFQSLKRRITIQREHVLRSRVGLKRCLTMTMVSQISSQIAEMSKDRCNLDAFTRPRVLFKTRSVPHVYLGFTGTPVAPQESRSSV